MGFFFNLFKSKQPEPANEDRLEAWTIKFRDAFDAGYDAGLKHGRQEAAATKQGALNQSGSSPEENAPSYPQKITYPPRLWEKDEDEFLIIVWGNWSFERLSDKFKRSPDAVRVRGLSLKLPNLGRRYKFPNNLKEADVLSVMVGKKDYFL
jgi:hypothetical protein